MSLRQVFDQEGATQATLEAVLDRLNALPTANDIQKAQLQASQAFIGYINPNSALDFLNGRLRHVSVKRNVAAGATGIMTLSNPTGSGKNLLVMEFDVDSNVNVEATYVLDPVISDTPTTHTSWMPNRAYEGAGLPTVGLVRSGVTGYTGGTIISQSRLLSTVLNHPRQFSVVLPPGKSVGVTTTAPGGVGGQAHDLYVECLWADVGIAG